MLDQADGTVHFGLGDYLSLQAWTRQHYLLRISLCFFGGAFAAAFLALVISGISLKDSFASLISNWIGYLPIFLIGFIVVVLLPFPLTILAWFTKKLPSEMLFSFDDSKFRYSSGGHEISIAWSNFRSISQTAKAYFLRSDQLILRLPKRAFSAQQRANFEEMAFSKIIRS